MSLTTDTLIRTARQHAATMTDQASAVLLCTLANRLEAAAAARGCLTTTEAMMNEDQFLNDLRELLAQQPFRRADIAMYPATDKEDAARWCADNARMSTKTDLWMVYLVSESTPEGEIDGTRYVEHAVTSAITGNGPRSEHYARLYMLLHNAAPNIVRALEERNALPALLAVARASARLAAAEDNVQRLIDDDDGSDAQYEAMADAHTRESDAYAVWRAALRALEPPTNDTP